MSSRRLFFKLAGGGGGSLPFDLFGTPIAGFSFRKLSSDYTGYCCRIRRSSDDALLDIGFVNDVVDISAISEFVGSGSGYIKIFYNQGSVEANFIQENNSKQPRIVNAGTLETENGKICMRFLGGQVLTAGDNFDNYASSSVAVTYFTTGVGKMTSDYSVLFGKVSAYGLIGQKAILRNTVDNLLADGNYITDNIASGVQMMYSQFSEHITGQNTLTYDRFYKNNIQKGSTTNVYRGDTTYRYLIGAGDISGSEFWYMNGTFQELIIYKNLTANVPSLSDVNTNINDYYSIY